MLYEGVTGKYVNSPKSEHLGDDFYFSKMVIALLYKQIKGFRGGPGCQLWVSRHTYWDARDGVGHGSWWFNHRVTQDS